MWLVSKVMLFLMTQWATPAKNAHSKISITEQEPSSHGIDKAVFAQNQIVKNKELQETICTPQKKITTRKKRSDRNYKIEKSLAKWFRNGEFACLIKWENYSDTHKTWEPRVILNKVALQSVKMLNIPLIE